MKKFTIQILLLLLIIGFGMIFFKLSETGTPNIPFVPQSTKKANLQINNALLKVELADTQEKRSKGLGGRENLASDEGMLFLFDKPDKYAFWMKGLKFPLDFIWIKDDTVVDFLANVPMPAIGQPDQSLPVYSSKVEINKVLEVNAGTIQRLNIKAGDRILIVNP